jgi:ferredoxin
VTDKVEFGDRCEWCLGCVHLCPKNAIHLKSERSAIRWRNPDVSLHDIIEANDRNGETHN